MIVFKDNVVIIGLIAFAVGFIEVCGDKIHTTYMLMTACGGMALVLARGP